MRKFFIFFPVFCFWVGIAFIAMNWSFLKTYHVLWLNSLSREYQYATQGVTPICMDNSFKAANFNLTKDGSVLVPILISKNGGGIQNLLQESGCPQATIGESDGLTEYDWYVKSVFCYKTNKGGK